MNRQRFKFLCFEVTLCSSCASSLFWTTYKDCLLTTAILPPPLTTTSGQKKIEHGWIEFHSEQRSNFNSIRSPNRPWAHRSSRWYASTYLSINKRGYFSSVRELSFTACSDLKTVGDEQYPEREIWEALNYGCQPLFTKILKHNETSPQKYSIQEGYSRSLFNDFLHCFPHESNSI
jgi:hypothetical protein